MSDMQIAMTHIFQQGKIARIDGEYDLAITLLQKAIAENPQFAQAHLELGLAYCFNGSFDEAIAAMQEAVRLDASNADIHLHLAKTYTMLGMYEEGQAAFQQVLALSQAGEEAYDEAEKQLSFFSDFL